MLLRLSSGAATLLSLLALGPGCGGTHPTSAASEAASKQSFSTRHNDRDNDGDRNDDDQGVLGFGHEGSPADRRESTALLSRYYAAAATADGGTGCALLVPFVAEALPEQTGRAPRMRHAGCAAAISRLFAEHRKELALKRATLRVLAVRVQGNRALAVLDFPTIPEVRQMVERRVAGHWRLLLVLDGIIE